MYNTISRIVYSHNASLEIKEAAGWYNKQRNGLGKYLRKDIKIVHDKIKNNPFFASALYNNIRSTSCKHFPYSLHYYIDEIRNQIVILSFFHHSRKPDWLTDSKIV